MFSMYIYIYIWMHTYVHMYICTMYDDLPGQHML